MANKIKLSPSRQMTRVSFRGRQNFAIFIRNVKLKGIPNSLRNYGVDLHFQHWNLMVNSSLDLNSSMDFSNVINPRRCCVNLQAIWNIISTWSGRIMDHVDWNCFPFCRNVVRCQLLSCTCSDVRLISRRNTKEVVV
jgi:hypothetical protein